MQERKAAALTALSPAPGESSERPARDGSLEFASLYDSWFAHVTRWLRALGAPEADIEDLAQEVFLVVRRRLCDFDGRNVPGWLYRIATRKVRQHRRRRWIQSLFAAKSPIDIDDLPWHGASAVATLETQEKRRLLETLVAKMSEKRRVAFRLFEIEGYNGEEIAELLDVPINTVWTRLFHARKDFFSLLSEHRRAQRDEG
ncbi:MAG TPA: sigma-70 family RNA polymerase sigma factor [Polyangiaceae bacterium]|nr:sigma-70 family RNA polymerase sigma factor [Polyangiaceae bacterium]